MLASRLSTAAIILIPLVALLLADYFWNFGAPGVWLLPVGLALALLAVGEMLDLLSTQKLHPEPIGAYGGVALVVLAAGWPIWGRFLGGAQLAGLGVLGWPLAATALALLVILTTEMRRYKEPGVATIHAALGMFTVVYVGLLMAFLVELRIFYSNAWGMAALVSLLFVVKLSDTGAYFTGRRFGRRRITPRLSPKKTLEGFAGGLVVACAASWVFFAWLAPWIADAAAPSGRWWNWLLYGLALGVMGVVGDLAESMLKRDMKRKDSSTWIPGLGGVLDFLDSPLAAAPVAYIMWAQGVVGPLGDV